MITLLRSSKL